MAEYGKSGGTNGAALTLAWLASVLAAAAIAWAIGAGGARRYTYHDGVLVDGKTGKIYEAAYKKIIEHSLDEFGKVEPVTLEELNRGR